MPLEIRAFKIWIVKNLAYNLELRVGALKIVNLYEDYFYVLLRTTKTVTEQLKQLQNS